MTLPDYKRGFKMNINILQKSLKLRKLSKLPEFICQKFKSYVRYQRFYWLFQLQNIRSLAEYRADFFMMICFTAFSQFCNLAVTGVIYSNIPYIAGWDLWEILLLYSFLLFSEGCINFFFQGSWKINEIIHQADLDRFLLRPLPVGLQLLTARIDFDGLSKMTIASLIFLTSASRCYIAWTPKKILLFLLLVIGICIIRTCMIWITSCLSFWMDGRPNSLNYFILTLGELGKYPLTIFPTPLRILFAYLIPYAFISYYPAIWLLDKEKGIFYICIPAAVILISILMLTLSAAVLKFGLRRYESNNI